MSDAPLIYAIGDIHGMRDLLDELLDRIKGHANGRPYQLIFMGDYIDRGPNSKQVIDRLIEIKNQNWEYPPVFLKGNHEDNMQHILYRKYDWDFMGVWMAYGGDATIESYGVDCFYDARYGGKLSRAFRKAVDPAHREFLKSLPLSYETEKYFFCHAGVDFDKPLNKQNKDALLWSRKKFTESAQMAEKQIVHGHTITKDFKPYTGPNRIGLDTGAFKSKVLTAGIFKGREEPEFIMTGW